MITSAQPATAPCPFVALRGLENSVREVRDAEGRLVERAKFRDGIAVYYDAPIAIYGAETYVYGEVGHLLEKATYRPSLITLFASPDQVEPTEGNHKIVGCTRYAYDERGRCEAAWSIGSGGSLESVTLYFYSGDSPGPYLWGWAPDEAEEQPTLVIVSDREGRVSQVARGRYRYILERSSGQVVRVSSELPMSEEHLERLKESTNRRIRTSGIGGWLRIGRQRGT